MENGKTDEWISKEEKELVNQLRTRIQKELPPWELRKSPEDQDAFLLRWLRARELDVDKAEAMLSKALQWRKESRVDNFQELKAKVDPFYLESFLCPNMESDKKGQPVFLIRFCDWDFRKIISANKEEQFGQFICFWLESFLVSIQEYNYKRKPGEAPITQMTIIADASNYPYGQLFSLTAMRKWFQTATLYEAYFPEILYRAFVINCPSYFQIFLNMLKGFIAPRTMEKIVCYSKFGDWQNDIDTYVDPAKIPESFGGTSKLNPFQSKPGSSLN